MLPNTSNNDAVRLFTGETTEIAGHTQDQRRFEIWYDQFTIRHLTFLQPQHSDILRYIFNLIENNHTDYYQQFTSIGKLSRDLHKAVCFIAYEFPTSQQHFIFGILLMMSCYWLIPSV